MTRQHVFQVTVTAPEAMPPDRVRALLNDVLDVGYAEAQASADDPDLESEDAEAVGELSIEVQL